MQQPQARHRGKKLVQPVPVKGQGNPEKTGERHTAHQPAGHAGRQKGLRQAFQPLLQTGGCVTQFVHLVAKTFDIRTARHFTLEAAEKARQGIPFRTEAAIAKLTASEGGGRVVDRAMQIHGGMGMTKDLPLERWYREMRSRRVGEGPSEVQRMVIAREILGSNLR